ncbi:Para-aminobenzoate synthase, amidotransferase component [Labilithrix luteola]|uniref:aminodeoxychorismate synthase n=1 Tax=Labilithrix luteola TaxID=1391654 RepID=A0A0K1QDA5_9BACT|nr:aminodeoxychorismate synthase component I [Labilithrix luteola]AKV03415.1 Para-aminobenzoate synthase, amidotransferase component [Labilithrix luteola]
MSTTIHLLEEIELAHRFDAYRDAFPAGRGTFLLDGAGAGEHLAGFALLGSDPIASFRASRTTDRRRDGGLKARVTLAEGGRSFTLAVDDALEALRMALAKHAIDPSEYVARPLPLLAGAVGYVSYEVGQMIERLPCLARPSLGMPDIAFGFHDWILGLCHRTGRTWLSVVGRGASSSEARQNAERRRDDVLASIANFEARGLARPQASEAKGSVAPSQLRPLLSRDAYLARIHEAKEHIAAGDTFEICLTQPFEATADRERDAPRVWRILREKNPAPFAAFLDFPEGAVVSSSPERFVRLDAGRVAESRPIKGTRPRGSSPADDARLIAELASSTKDRAENAMIVDLVRNDLGKICRYGSVTVPELYAVESYATVHQMVSTIRGELDARRDAVDVLRACFPPGSMTGAPKIEAMSILERLEIAERGVYSGGLGFFDFSGTLDLSVVIRTAVFREGRAQVHVGGAIVDDSEPNAEYEETLQKVRALASAFRELERLETSALVPAAEVHA